MYRKSLIANLKSSINDYKYSTIFTQTIYESSNFNSNTDTDYILGSFFEKSKFDKHKDVSHSKLRKEKINATFKFGAKNSFIFIKKNLSIILKDNS